MAVLPWGLLEAVILTGKFLKKTKDSTRIKQEKLKLGEKSLKVVKEVQRISKETGRPVSQVAINWVRQPKAQMIPILGARSVKQLHDNFSALDWKLTDEKWKCLDEVSAIDLGFQHGFLDGNRYIHGAKYDKIDNHRA